MLRECWDWYVGKGIAVKFALAFGIFFLFILIGTMLQFVKMGSGAKQNQIMLLMSPYELPKGKLYPLLIKHSRKPVMNSNRAVFIDSESRLFFKNRDRVKDLNDNDLILTTHGIFTDNKQAKRVSKTRVFESDGYWFYPHHHAYVGGLPIMSNTRFTKSHPITTEKVMSEIDFQN